MRALLGIATVGVALLAMRRSEAFGALPVTKSAWMLAILEREDRPMTSREIADELGLETTFVGASLRHLAARGLVSVVLVEGVRSGRNLYSFVGQKSKTRSYLILDLLEKSGEMTSPEIAAKLGIKVVRVVDALMPLANRGQVSIRSRPGRGRGGKENVYSFKSRSTVVPPSTYQGDLTDMILKTLQRERRPMTGWEIAKYLGIARRDKDQVFDILRHSELFSVTSRPSIAWGGRKTNFYYLRSEGERD